MDRGFIFKLINSYFKEFNLGDPRILQEYKFVFLEAICSHEHYVIFNLPVSHTRLLPKNRSPEFMQEFCLSEDFRRYHFLSAILLQEVKTSLNDVAHVRKVALNTLRNLVAKHELDDRSVFFLFLGCKINNRHYYVKYLSRFRQFKVAYTYNTIKITKNITVIM